MSDAYTASNLTQLYVLEQDMQTFKQPDPTLKRIVAAQSDRLKNAARMLGREWSGTFTEAHVLLIAKAYLYAKEGERDFGH
jgi:hypothetical protein